MNYKYTTNLACFCLVRSIFLLSTITYTTLPAQGEQVAKESFILSQRFPPQDNIQPSLPTSAPEQPLSPPADLISPGEAMEVEVAETITVDVFEIVGSTVFSREELAATVAEFTQRPISLTELFQARSKITELYTNKGYITSGAYIPPQEITSGVVTIQVLEGELEDIKITGTQRLHPNYIRSRLAIATKPPLNQERLLEELQKLQQNPLIANISAELSTGLSPNTSLLQVEIQEAKSFQAQTVFDNGRSLAVGSFRRKLQLNEGNLLGIGDSLSLAYTNTDGSNAFDASYIVPVNPYNGTVSFNLGIASNNIIEKPFNILDIQSASRYYELTFRQLLWQTPRQEFALGVSASRIESEASFQPDERQPFDSLGSDEAGRTRISALRFFQEWTTRNSQQVIAFRSQFNLGIGALNATINPQPPDSRFFAWRGQAQWVRLLAPETLLLVRGNTQLASRTLLPLEQWGLGGLGSVRGYRQDLLLTDNGALASVELQLPILRATQIDGMLQVIPFVDLGWGWNHSSRENPDANTLAAVGLGWRWSQGNRFTARLDWGIPLVSVNSNNRGTWQEKGLYFYVQYNPF
jgi:hemolysin activation/secretion protein